jgi:3-oxoacyl-[acyl-carrier-protein] synthase II
MQRRVVITGIGVISPLGNTLDELRSALIAGRSGIGPLQTVPTGNFDFDWGGEARGFTGAIEQFGPLDKNLQRAIRKGQKLMCREIEMGVAAAQLALHDSGLDESRRDADRTGVLFGCDYILTAPEEFAEGIRGCMDGHHEFSFTNWAEQGMPRVNPLWLLKYLPNMPASHVAIYNDLRGPNNSITIREASSCAAVAEAWTTITRGHADVMIVGATGTKINCLRTLHASLQESLATHSAGIDQGAGSTACRPFDASRCGAVLGEGAGAIILESAEHAERRGAVIRGEIRGAGSSAVGRRQTDANIRASVANSLRQALRGLSERPGHCHAHGLSTVDGDLQEAAGIRDALGEATDRTPVVAAKSAFGNLGAGGGMVEIIASLGALESGQLFPTQNVSRPDPHCRLEIVRDNGRPAGDSFVSVNYTPQGQSSAVAIARWPAA